MIIHNNIFPYCLYFFPKSTDIFRYYNDRIKQIITYLKFITIAKSRSDIY